MLSLFFGVGIGRILRYRSSNTSMVDSVSLPALFPSNSSERWNLAQKNYTEKQPDPGRRGFRLMFETLWIPPYDRRRCNALVADFDLCARSAVTRLAATDLAAASGIELDEMRYAVECLLRSIERLDAARLLPPERCAEALESVRRIVAGLRERCADPV